MSLKLLPDRIKAPQSSLWIVFGLMVSVASAGCSDKASPPATSVDVILDASAPSLDSTADASGPSVDLTADASAPLSLFAAGATQASVMAAVPGFATENGLTVNYTFGAVGSLRNQIEAGTSGADVAIVTPVVITALDAEALVHAGSRVDLAQIGGGLAVRSGDQLPDISDSDKFKVAVLSADEIYYADPALATAGAAFMKICTTLGITDACAAAPDGKGHIFAGGAQAMAAMALSTATKVVGVTQVSEIKATPGVELVAEYPETPVNLQVRTIYSAIIVEGTKNLANAQLLVQFLSGDAFKTQLAMYGFEPTSTP